jgi:DNA-binding transcriptional MerR regulator
VSDLLSTSDLASRVQVTKRTIRYYVAEGLLPPPIEKGAAQFFDREHEVRLRMIKILREEGLPLRRIRQELEKHSLSDLQMMLEIASNVRDGGLGPREVLDRLGSSSMVGAATPVVWAAVPDYSLASPPSPAPGLWRRIRVADGVELHVETRAADGERGERIQSLIDFAMDLFAAEAEDR